VIGKLFSLPSVLIGLVIYGLISLGMWQLDRADEKQAIIDKIKLAQHAPAQLATLDELANKAYHNVLLKGYYDSSRQFIYDNQIIKGNAGYYVMTPFMLNQNTAILVNRGFVAWHGRRDKLANIAVDNQPRLIEVALIKPLKRLELTQPPPQSKFPLLIQSIDISRLEAMSTLQFVPIIARLSKQATAGFFRQWQPFYGSKDKHLGYALQWFLMALVLLIIGVRLLRK
jgi:surfeit locus 1 family protein